MAVGTCAGCGSPVCVSSARWLCLPLSPLWIKLAFQLRFTNLLTLLQTLDSPLTPPTAIQMMFALPANEMQRGARGGDAVTNSVLLTRICKLEKGTSEVSPAVGCCVAVKPSAGCLQIGRGGNFFFFFSKIIDIWQIGLNCHINEINSNSGGKTHTYV